MIAKILMFEWEKYDKFERTYRPVEHSWSESISRLKSIDLLVYSIP